jgi:hypothetical protein
MLAQTLELLKAQMTALQAVFTIMKEVYARLIHVRNTTATLIRALLTIVFLIKQMVDVDQ